MSRKVIALIALLILLMAGLFFSLFKQQTVVDANWNNDHRYESIEPYGTSTLHAILEKAYGKDHVITMNDKNDLPSFKEGSRKGYLIISEYLSYDQRKAEELIEFVKNGNDAIIISSSIDYYLDSLFSTFFTLTSRQDSIINLSNIQSEKSFELSNYYLTLDTVRTKRFYGLDSLDRQSEFRIDTLSTLNDTLPVFIKITWHEGSFYIHTVPRAFDNIAFVQESMNDYAITTLPLLDVDTLYLDHSSYEDQHWESEESPLQFIMGQPALKWAYYITILGLILFVISRGKRRQKVIPPLKLNENTSVEYVYTLSELYRSQGQHDKLAKHLKTIFTQYIKKKYYISADDKAYASKISRKSKIPEEDITNLINRLNRAQGNKRFGSEQLINLHTDLNQFYKNCK